MLNPEVGDLLWANGALAIIYKIEEGSYNFLIETYYNGESRRYRVSEAYIREAVLELKRYQENGYTRTQNRRSSLCDG
jgi:hypothetical protein